MATSSTQKKTANSNNKQDGRKTNGASKRSASPKRATQSRRQRYARNMPEVPNWLAAVMSVVGVGVAVGAGLYATRKQWLPMAEEWRNDFGAAFADDETDHENFDQTRHAGKDSMRDHPGDDWEDIDDMSDASFPASDPPSFNPGTASAS